MPHDGERGTVRCVRAHAAFRTDAAALGEALTLFIDRPDYGFVWLAYLDDLPVACASASLSIDTATVGLLPERRPARNQHDPRP